MLVKVDVTAEDIAKGVQGDCSECPIALAVKRVVNPDVLVLVGSFVTLQLQHPRSYTDSIYPPEEVSRFIDRFDDYKAVTPFSFELDIDDEMVKADA